MDVNRQCRQPFGALFFAVAVLLVTSVLSGCSSDKSNSESSPSEDVMINVSANGIYRISLSDLEEVGLRLDSIDPTVLKLSHKGIVVPFLAIEDSLYFYGESSNSRYSKLRPYLLSSNQPGAAMEPETLPLLSGPRIESVPQLIRLEENQIYKSNAVQANEFENDGSDDLSKEPWFWQTIQVGSKNSIEFQLPEIANEPAVIRIALWGASYNKQIDNDHDIDLIINGHRAGTVIWDGENYFVSEIDLPSGILQEGANTLMLDNQVAGAAPIDIMDLDWIEIDYPALPITANDQFAVADSSGVISIEGFQDQPIGFDISDPGSPKSIQGIGFKDNQAVLSVANGMELLVIGPSGILEPDSMRPARKSNLASSSNRADLIILSPKALIAPLEDLAVAREKQGLNVALIPVEDVYDEFGYGYSSPDSIVEFLKTASQNWSAPKPRYLLLVGDGTYDYRGYLADGPEHVIPSPMVKVEYSGETVSDTRLADIDGDALPDLAVGRWPVDNLDDVTNLVKRTLAYESGEANDTTIFAADGTSREFANLSDSIIGESGLDQEYVERLYGVPAEQLTAAWSEGAWLVSYTGHGSLDRWGKDDVYTNEAIKDLKLVNAPPIVVQLTCLTGFFAHPSISSISESMLLHNNGPVLIIAATSLTLSSSQRPFAINLLRELQNTETKRIGDAIIRSKRDLPVEGNSALLEIVDTFGLLGDPSALIVRPTNGRN